MPWMDRVTGRRQPFSIERANRHALAALEWLQRAQDATPDDGIARGYAMRVVKPFGARGWQPSYPETTGYIIPTLLASAYFFDRPEAALRAHRAALWETSIQLPSGAVVAGVVGQDGGPAAFNTGQVVFGWLAAAEAFDDERCYGSAERACRWLADTLSDDGLWHSVPFADRRWTLYNARTAWAMAAASERLSRPALADVARRNLDAVASAQCENGWLPDCCLDDAERPLLHTLGYAARGLLEGGWIISEERHVRAGERIAEVLASLVEEDGWLSGRFDREWRAASSWACLTGMVQMANVWWRLYETTGAPHWLQPAKKVLEFVCSTQELESEDPGVLGGVRGSHPVGGAYGPHQVLSWATKFLLDAILRSQVVDSSDDADCARFLALA